MPGYVRNRELTKYTVSVYPKLRQLYFPRRAVALYGLKNYQTVTPCMFVDDMFYLHFFRGDDGARKVHVIDNTVRLISADIFGYYNLQKGYYQIHKDIDGLIAVNITRPLTDEEAILRT